MIRVEVKLYAFLQKYRPEVARGEPLVIETEEGTTIAGLLRKLGVPEEVARLTFVNGVQQRLSYVLQPNDSVGVFPPIAGGWARQPTILKQSHLESTVEPRLCWFVPLLSTTKAKLLPVHRSQIAPARFNSSILSPG